VRQRLEQEIEILPRQHQDVEVDPGPTGPVLLPGHPEAMEGGGLDSRPLEVPAPGRRLGRIEHVDFLRIEEDEPRFGVIGSWRHPDEDFRPELASRKIQTYRGGHQLMRNLWVQGSGYLMPRSLVERHGLLGESESFTGYCIRAARAGAVNGYYYPFVPEDHMDDPRSPHTLIRTDEDLRERTPLSAQANGIRTVDDWVAQIQRSAHVLQTASLDPRDHEIWKRKLASARRRVRKLVGGRARW
jgi:hypothetical protein